MPVVGTQPFSWAGQAGLPEGLHWSSKFKHLFCAGFHVSLPSACVGFCLKALALSVERNLDGHQSLNFKCIYLSVSVYLRVCVCASFRVHTSRHMCRSQRSASGNQFSPVPLGIQGSLTPVIKPMHKHFYLLSHFASLCLSVLI